MQRGRSLTVVLLVAAFITGCYGPPGGPSHLETFRLAGPAEVAPGTTVPIKALLDRVATLSDVSEEVQWISSNPSVLSVDSGHATAHTAGETILTALLGEQQTEAKSVMVIPPGTYRLRGLVQSQGVTPPPPVGMARVEVPAVGVATTTDAQGRYTLYGVPPNAEIRASKEGYAPATTVVRLANHEQQAPTLVLRPVLEGTFALTISAGSCSDGPPLPANLLQRKYSVVLAFSNSSGAPIRGTFPGTNITVVAFFGSLSSQGWSFEFTIGEPQPDGKVLTYNGLATVRVTDLVGTFNGRIALYEPSTGATLARCTASGFPFVLTR